MRQKYFAQRYLLFILPLLLDNFGTVSSQKEVLSSSNIPGGITVQVIQYQYENGSTVNNVNNLSGGPGGPGAGKGHANNESSNSSNNQTSKPSAASKNVSLMGDKFKFGVSFCPYVFADDDFPQLGTMLKVIINSKFNSITTNWLQGKRASTTKCQIACTAAQLNKLSKATTIKVSQGCRVVQNNESNGPQKEIETVLSSVQSTNKVWPGTVWSISFNVDNDWGFMQDANEMHLVNSVIKQGYGQRARDLGLKIGTKLDICSEIVDGKSKADLIELAKSLDFVVCFLYPPAETEKPDVGVTSINTIYQRYKKAFLEVNPALEVILETGWASEGTSDFNPDYLNTPEKQSEFWDRMRQLSQSESVGVYMYEAFDSSIDFEHYRHLGYFQKSKDGQYIEKFSGKIVPV